MTAGRASFLLVSLLAAGALPARADGDAFATQIVAAGREAVHLAKQLPAELRARRADVRPAVKRIGFMLGTFDPPHAGHLQVVDAAMRELGLDRLVLAPHARPLHKPDASPVEHRVAMAELAVAGRPEVTVQALSLPELLLEKSAVLASLAANCDPDDGPTTCYLVLGADVFEDHFQGNPALLRLTLRGFRVVVVDRPGVGPPELANDARFIHLTRPGARELSSSEIRDSLRAGGPAAGLAAPVLEYIRAHRLYSTQP